MPTSKTAALLGVTICLLFFAACGDGSTENGAALGYERVSPPTLTSNDDPPVPAGEVILSLSGDIANVNVADRLDLDLAMLEALGTVRYSVDDQQAEGRFVEFEGVLLEDLLRFAGAHDDAEMLVSTALNDYSIEIPVTDASESPVLVAIRVDGEEMPVDRFGPVRVVYPYGSHDLDPVRYDPRWIWQLRSIEIR